MTTMVQPICLRQPLLRPLCVRAVVARKIIEAVARRVPVDVLMPDGTLLGQPDADQWSADRPVLEIVRPLALFERLAHHPKIGIGEAYMAGDWRAAPGTDLAELLLPFAERLTTIVPPALARLRRVVDRRIPHTQRNSMAGSRKNIQDALRPQQRPVRGLPRRDAELQLRTLRQHDAVVRAGLRGGAAAQGQRDPRPGSRRRGLPGAGDRHRLGHPGDRGGPARGARHHADPVGRAGRARAGAGRRRRVHRPRRHSVAGLPRGRRHLRRDRECRDDRGGRRGVLADVLLHARRPARTRRHRGHPGDLDEPRPLPRHPELLRLDPEAHLPRRADPLAARDRGHCAAAHRVCGSPR